MQEFKVNLSIYKEWRVSQFGVIPVFHMYQISEKLSFLNDVHITQIPLKLYFIDQEKFGKEVSVVERQDGRGFLMMEIVPELQILLQEGFLDVGVESYCL